MLTSRTLLSEIYPAGRAKYINLQQTNGIIVDTAMHRTTSESQILSSMGVHSELPAENDPLVRSCENKFKQSLHSINDGKKTIIEVEEDNERQSDEMDFEPTMYRGYVKRMAARNAMACVNAMFETVKKKKNTKEMHTSGDTASFQFSSDSVQSADQNHLNHKENRSSRMRLKKRKNSENSSQTYLLNKKRKQLSSEVEKGLSQDLESKESSPSSFTLNTVFSESDPESTESLHSTASGECNIFLEYCDTLPFNTLGLLYNGDCIHSKTRFFFKTPDLSLTTRILPTVVPTFNEDVLLIKEKNVLESKNDDVKHRHSQKGNNGWLPIGNQIKTISINSRKDNEIQRKYFIGITRKKQEIFSRDSVLLRSGNKKGDMPYVAKISSIWQENSGILMMTVFWYYRPEDTDTIISSQFVESEVMASQHHDDISVACIDDKCHVLGFKEFCRFRATIEQLPLIKSARSSQSVTKLKQNLSKVTTVNLQFHQLVQSEVYLCFRSYNHIAGKIMKV